MVKCNVADTQGSANVSSKDIFSLNTCWEMGGEGDEHRKRRLAETFHRVTLSTVSNGSRQMSAGCVWGRFFVDKLCSYNAIELQLKSFEKHNCHQCWSNQNHFD